MIEKTIYEYMQGALTTPCYMMRPERAPDTYVVFEKTGGSKENHILQSTFAFQSYAPTLMEAMELNEQVKDAVNGMVSLDDITRVHYETDYNFTNTADKHPRYQAVFEITHY